MIRQVLPNLIPNPTKGRQPMFFGPVDGGGIFKIMVYQDSVCEKNRAGLVGVIANRKYVVELLPPKLIDAF